jgi:hypothetical protein
MRNTQAEVFGLQQPGGTLEPFAEIERSYRKDFFRNPISGAFNSAASGSAGSL